MTADNNSDNEEIFYFQCPGCNVECFYRQTPKPHTIMECGKCHCHMRILNVSYPKDRPYVGDEEGHAAVYIERVSDEEFDELARTGRVYLKKKGE